MRCHTVGCITVGGIPASTPYEPCVAAVGLAAADSRLRHRYYWHFLCTFCLFTAARALVLQSPVGKLHACEYLRITSCVMHVAFVADALTFGGLMIKLFIPRCSHCWGIDATSMQTSTYHVSICNCRAQVSRCRLMRDVISVAVGLLPTAVALNFRACHRFSGVACTQHVDHPQGLWRPYWMHTRHTWPAGWHS